MGRNLSSQERIMSVIRASVIYMEDSTHCNDVSILLKPRSDFINLSKLSVLGLARKLEANEGEESQRTLTQRGCIWENMMRIAEIIANSMRMEIKIESTSDRDIRLSIVRENRLMGIVSESVSVTSVLSETLTSLSEEEWDWVAITPEEIQNGKPLRWSPSEDPRPEWRIQRDKDELSPVPKDCLLYTSPSPRDS